MKRTFVLAAACLALVLFALPGFALAEVPPTPVTGVEVHFISQNATETLPAPNPAHPEDYGPDITFSVSLELPTDATDVTTVVGVNQAPILYYNLWQWPDFNYPLEKVCHLTGSTASVIVTMTPIVTAGELSYVYNVQTQRFDATTQSTETNLHGVLVTSTPEPVFNPKMANGQLTWDNFLPVYYDGNEWVNYGTSGQGGPIGSLEITANCDGASMATTTVDGEATSCAVPEQSAGHQYTYTVTRSANGMTSQAVSTSTIVWAGTSSSIKGPSSARHRKTFRLYGAVSPVFAGTGKVQRWRKVHGHWRSYGSSKATVSNGSWSWKYHTSTKGYWRFRFTYVPKSGTYVHGSSSGYKAVHVK